MKTNTIESVTLNNPKRKIAIVVAILFSTTLFLFGPLQIYIGNISQVPFSFVTTITGIFLAWFLIFIIVAFLFIYIPEKHFFSIITVVFLVSLLFWFEGNIFVINYGPLNGLEIHWDKHIISQIIDLIIWIGVILLGFAYRQKIFSQMPLICLALVSIQILGFGSLVTSQEIDWEKVILRTDPIEDSNLVSFSSEKNIVLIILDEFQTDLFQEFLERDPALADDYDGFILYQDATGSFPSTSLAIPHLLSDTWYDNSVTYTQYMQTQYKNKSIINVLTDNGVDVAYNVPFHGYSLNISNINSKSKGTININNMVFFENCVKSMEIFKMIPFRYFPHLFKKFVIYTPFVGLSSNEGHQDLIFNKQISEKFKIDNNKNTAVKLYYLTSAHEPIGYDSQLRKNFTTDWKEQAAGSLKIVNNLIKKLKHLNIYNNTSIIITGDHGRREGREKVLFSKNLSIIRNMSRPLLLVKPFNSTSPLQKSEKKVRNGQIPATIVTLLNISTNTYNKYDDIFTTEYNFRKFLCDGPPQGGTFEAFLSGYLTEIDEYHITGSSQNSLNYSFIRETYPK